MRCFGLYQRDRAGRGSIRSLRRNTERSFKYTRYDHGNYGGSDNHLSRFEYLQYERPDDVFASPFLIAFPIKYQCSKWQCLTQRLAHGDRHALNPGFIYNYSIINAFDLDAKSDKPSRSINIQRRTGEDRRPDYATDCWYSCGGCCFCKRGVWDHALRLLPSTTKSIEASERAITLRD